MKITNVAILILAIALALYILVPGLSWAEDGPALYTAKGSGFYAMRIPSGLGEFTRESGFSLGANAIHQVEAECLTGNAKKP